MTHPDHPLAAHRQPVPPLAASPRGRSVLHRETIVPRSLDDTFSFFADARNLDRITPPWVGFRILTPDPIDMRVGTLIDYRIRIRGIPIRWRTRIIHWDPPHSFVDFQVKGPYRWWQHQHRFERCAQGTRVIDTVEYTAPFRRLTHPLLVDRDVARIFEYRAEALMHALAVPPAN